MKHATDQHGRQARGLFRQGKSGLLFDSVAIGLALAILGGVLGCDRAPPPPTDPAKAPWLLDPKSQMDGLKNSDYRIRGISAFNLGNMGAKAVDAIPELERLARDDENQKVRDNAREALEKIHGATGGD